MPRKGRFAAFELALDQPRSLAARAEGKLGLECANRNIMGCGGGIGSHETLDREFAHPADIMRAAYRLATQMKAPVENE